MAPTKNAGIIVLFDRLGLDVGYSTGVIVKECSAFDVKLKHLSLNYRPFSGTFYLGAGGAHEDLIVTNTYTPTDTEFTIKAHAVLVTTRMGWLWGIRDAGFWGGFDIGRYDSVSSRRDHDAPGIDTASEDYKNADANVKRFAESYFLTLMLRFGWLI